MAGKSLESIAALLVKIGDMTGGEEEDVIIWVHSNPLSFGF